MKFGVQIEYNECYSKIHNYSQKGVAWSRDLLFNFGIPQYFRNGESYKHPKVVNGDGMVWYGLLTLNWGLLSFLYRAVEMGLKNLVFPALLLWRSYNNFMGPRTASDSFLGPTNAVPPRSGPL